MPAKSTVAFRQPIDKLGQSTRVGFVHTQLFAAGCDHPTLDDHGALRELIFEGAGSVSQVAENPFPFLLFGQRPARAHEGPRGMNLPLEPGHNLFAREGPATE